MYNIESLLDTTTPSPKTGRWIPARPEQAYGWMGFKIRLHDAWAVITGRAEAVCWPTKSEAPTPQESCGPKVRLV